MKVLHLLDIPWDSGLAHYALVLAQGLQAGGHEVVFGCKPGEKPWDKAARFGLETTPHVSWTGWSGLRDLIRTRRFDIVNAHTGSTHTLAVAAAAGTAARVIRTRSDARPARRSVGTRLLYRRTAKAIAAAAYIREDMVRTLHIPPERTVTVYQGIDLAVFRPAPLPAAPTFGMVARLDPVKGHAVLLQAMQKVTSDFPSLRLILAGQSENIKEADLRRDAVTLRVDRLVEFLGFQPDVPGVMRRCSVGVIASLGSEAVSRVALEWMACGRPIVATRVGCLPELVKDGVTGYLVAPGDPAALTAAMRRLAGEPGTVDRMGQAARADAEARFGLHRFIRETEAVYAAACSEC